MNRHNSFKIKELNSETWSESSTKKLKWRKCKNKKKMRKGNVEDKEEMAVGERNKNENVYREKVLKNVEDENK